MNINYKSLAILVSFFTLTFVLVLITGGDVKINPTSTEYQIPIKEISYSPGEHKITEDVVIKEDEVLTINPGTKLYFTKGKKIIAHGGLVVKGSNQAPVIFDSVDSEGWGGVEISASEPDIDFLNFSFTQRSLEGISLMVKNLILEREKLKGEYFQTRIENVIFRNIRNENGSALKIKNSNAFFDSVIVDTVSSFGIEAMSSALVAKNIKMDICRSVNFVDADDSLLFISNSSFKRSCDLKQKESLGEIFGEGIGLKASKLIISNSKIMDTDDDAIELDKFSLALSYKNYFYDIGDSSIDASGNSFVVSLSDHFASKRQHVSLTNSTGLVSKAVFSKNNFACVLLRNQSEGFLFESACLGNFDTEFFFDVRECFKHKGQCLGSAEDYNRLGKYIYNLNPKWNKITLDDMISYGGEYKDFMLNYPKNAEGYEEYRSFLSELYSKYFNSSKIITTNPVKYFWHYDLKEIGENENIQKEKIKDFISKIEGPLNE